MIFSLNYFNIAVVSIILEIKIRNKIRNKNYDKIINELHIPVVAYGEFDEAVGGAPVIA